MEILTTMSLVIYLVGCVVAFGLIKFADKHNNKATPLGEALVWTSISWGFIYTLVIMVIFAPLADRLRPILFKKLAIK